MKLLKLAIRAFLRFSWAVGAVWGFLFSAIAWRTRDFICIHFVSGAGTFASVHVCKQKKTGDKYAVKKIKRSAMRQTDREVQ